MPVREINIGSRGLQSNSNRSQQIGSGRFRWIGSFRQAESLTFSDQSSRQSRFAENRRSAPRGLCAIWGKEEWWKMGARISRNRKWQIWYKNLFRIPAKFENGWICDIAIRARIRFMDGKYSIRVEFDLKTLAKSFWLRLGDRSFDVNFYSKFYSTHNRDKLLSFFEIYWSALSILF